MCKKIFARTAMILSISICASNALAKKNSEDSYDYNYAQINNRCAIYDPYEKLNRKIFLINGTLDFIILRPITKMYGRFTNDYTKSRIGSFTGNITEPLSSVNYAIQGKSENMFKTFWRFAINSTVGVLGLFDVASKMGITAQPQTLGNTLASYGIGPGPYIVLPMYGGMVARDAMDPIKANNLLNPNWYFMHKSFIHTNAGLSLINSRHNVMPFTDYVSKNSTDPYISMRDAIINEREAKMAYPEDFKCPSVKNN